MDVPRAYDSDAAAFDRCLFEALLELMGQAPLDRITAGDIVAHAHVSRASFYRRYKDKYDLLNATYERILEETLFTVTSGTSWRDAIRQIYAVIERDASFFRNAFASHDVNSLRNYIFDRTLRLETDVLSRAGIDIEDPAVQYRLRAYVAGGLQLTVDWVRDGLPLSLDELVDILVEMVPEPFRPYFR